MRKRNFVLVHGAFMGGWCWKYVRDRLEGLGHRVYTPTLSGLADRSHLLSSEIRLGTHISDVANLIEWEELEDVVLVGHSYAGWVISGVSERVLPRLASIVFLDAALPNDGECVIERSGLASRERLAELQAAGRLGSPPPSAEFLGVMNKEDWAWVDSKMTPQPISLWTDPIRLSGARDRVPKKSYILATNFNSKQFRQAAEATRKDPSWVNYDLESGHNVMMDMPDRLVEILVEVA